MSTEPKKNLVYDIDWMTVRAILTTPRIINEAKGESRHTEDLEWEELDGFIHGLITEAEKLIKAGKIRVTE